MCKSFFEIKEGKIIKIKGKFKKGYWAICMNCGIISLGKDRSVKKIYSLDLVQQALIKHDNIG